MTLTVRHINSQYRKMLFIISFTVGLSYKSVTKFMIIIYLFNILTFEIAILKLVNLEQLNSQVKLIKKN